MKTEKLTVHFDDSLPALVDVVEAHLGRSSLEGGVVLREASGRLTFFADGELTPENLAALTDTLGRRSVRTHDRTASSPIGSRPAPRASSKTPAPARAGSATGPSGISIAGSSGQTGCAVLSEAPAPPQFVFASLKGGVGRSTLSVVAAEQARKGRNVLVIDMDLEAPGIGSDPPRPGPQAGFRRRSIIFAESGLGGLSTRPSWLDFVGTSALTSGAGLVDVMRRERNRHREASRRTSWPSSPGPCSKTSSPAAARSHFETRPEG